MADREGSFSRVGAMASLSGSLLLSSVLLLSLLSPAAAQSCRAYSFSNNRVFQSCADLPVLDSFLHYTHNPFSGITPIAYRHAGIAAPSQWVAWAINPTAAGMVGAQALVAYPESDGTMKCYTSPVSSYQTRLPEGTLSFDVSDLSATYSNNEVTIFATLRLPNASYAASGVNLVWQDGRLAGGSPAGHDLSGAHVQSMGRLDFATGLVGLNTGRGNSGTRKRNIHGALNAASWGVMMPIGAMIARYLRTTESGDPAWFYIHAGCQSSAYAIGAAGWGTGLKLGSESVGVEYTAHRSIGIVLFSVGTLQVMALFWRPKKEHKQRRYWKVYHRSVGCSVIVLGIVNIYKGLDILNPGRKWRSAYTGFLVALGLSAVTLEACTWDMVRQRKESARREEEKA